MTYLKHCSKSTHVPIAQRGKCMMQKKRRFFCYLLIILVYKRVLECSTRRLLRLHSPRSDRQWIAAATRADDYKTQLNVWRRRIFPAKRLRIITAIRVIAQQDRRRTPMAETTCSFTTTSFVGQVMARFLCQPSETPLTSSNQNASAS